MCGEREHKQMQNQLITLMSLNESNKEQPMDNHTGYILTWNVRCSAKKATKTIDVQNTVTFVSSRKSSSYPSKWWNERLEVRNKKLT